MIQRQGDPLAAVGSYVPPAASDTFGATLRSPRAWVNAALLMAAVAATSVASLIPSGSGSAPALWLPGAVALTVALVVPAYRRPLLMGGAALGATIVGLSGGLPLAQSATAGLTTAASAFLGAWLIRDVLHRSSTLRSWVDLAALTALGAIALPVAVASIRAPFGSRAWWIWVTGEGVAVVTVVPFLLVTRSGTASELIRHVLPSFILGALAALAVYGLAPTAGGAPRAMPFLGAPALVMIAAGVLWGVRGLSASSLGVAGVALPATARGLGPFALDQWTAIERVTSVEIFISLMAVALLGLAIGVGAHRDALARVSRDAESFEAIAASAPVGIVVLDASGACASVNERFTSITGVSAADAEGDGWLAMIHPEDREQVRVRWRAAFNAGNGLTERVRILGPQGVVRWTSAVFEVRRRQGKITGAVGVLTDVTGDVEAEDVKASFLSRTSHELRTPLTIILGLTQTLSRPDLTPDQRQDMERRVLERAHHLNGLIDRLLIASGKADEVQRPQAVAVDLDELLTSRALPLRGRGLSVTVDVEDGLAAALAPRDGIESVVDELLDNAQKFSPGGESFALDARAGDGAVVVGVTDWGIGMDAEQQQRCFDQFWQGEDKDTRRFEGTGIGLFVVKTLVESWGGTVTATSVLGSGSRFEFTVPQVSPKRRAAASRKRA